MNSVERIVHYAKAVEQEAPYEAPAHKPAVSWPAEGRVEFNHVVMKYRPELPPVLRGTWITYVALSSECIASSRGISMSLAGGEKIGFIGRTGAGKSSIMTGE